MLIPLGLLLNSIDALDSCSQFDRTIDCPVVPSLATAAVGCGKLVKVTPISTSGVIAEDSPAVHKLARLLLFGPINLLPPCAVAIASIFAFPSHDVVFNPVWQLTAVVILNMWYCPVQSTSKLDLDR